MHYHYMLELRRKIAHLLLGVALAFLVVSAPLEFVVVCNLLVLLGLLVCSFLHRRRPNWFLTWLFSRFDRKERLTAKGAITFFAGTLVAILLFAPLYAALSILVLSISDALATIAGYYAGRHRLIKNKTVEGSLVFCVCTFLILFLFVAPPKALLTAVIASATELATPAYLDDNITIPFVTGLLLSL
jgi:dolichol kinase